MSSSIDELMIHVINKTTKQYKQQNKQKEKVYIYIAKNQYLNLNAPSMKIKIPPDKTYTTKNICRKLQNRRNLSMKELDNLSPKRK